jgi:hypothetical protein
MTWHRWILIASACLLAAAIAVVVDVDSSGGREEPLDVATFKSAAHSGLETLVVTTDPAEGDAVDRALAVNLSSQLNHRLPIHCRQMGRPAGPYRYYCESTREMHHAIWWVTYLVDPHDGSVRFHRSGVAPLSRPT